MINLEEKTEKNITQKEVPSDRVILFEKVLRKKCSKCGKVKCIRDFHIRKEALYGVRADCKMCFKKNSQIYYSNNKDKIIINQKEYAKNNKDKTNAASRKYRKKNPEKRAELARVYLINNREGINKRQRKYKKERAKKDPAYKLRRNIAESIRGTFKDNGLKKSKKTEEILGCTVKFFKEYIESLWEPWMNWGNYGEPEGGVKELNISWEIDHFLASSLGKKSIEITIMLNHYTNLQPMCSYTNRYIKRNRLDFYQPAVFNKKFENFYFNNVISTLLFLNLPSLVLLSPTG